MTYRRRILDEVLDELFPQLPAIAIEGAKGVGKTATAERRAQTTYHLDNESELTMVEADSSLVTEGLKPVLVDEWQLHPPVWSAVRHAVDRHASPGSFLLTGSASAPHTARIHSGAGRIIRLVMRPMSLIERGIETPSVSLRDLITSSRSLISGRTSIGTRTYLQEILQSGFPGLRHYHGRALQEHLDGYSARIVDHDLVQVGRTIRRPRALYAWLKAYAAALSTEASYTAILDAATAGEDQKPSRQTADSYREYLEAAFLLDPLPAWTPTFSPLKRLAKSPKHHLVDPALAAALIGSTEESLIQGTGPARTNGSWTGALFESLAAQSVRVYAQFSGATVSHLRLRNGDREVDLIIEGRDGSVCAIEVKLSTTISDYDVRHLGWLEDKIGSRLVNKVVLYTGPLAYRRPDGVAVVPLSLLGP